MDKEDKERETHLIFSTVIQSSDVLPLPLDRLYDTVMLGSE